MTNAGATTPEPAARPSFTREQRLERACLRAAMHIRGLYEEKESSDTRLLESLILPDELIIVGRSLAVADGAPVWREHVVPRLFIIEVCHEMIRKGEGDEMIAAFIRDHIKVVLVSKDEAREIDNPLRKLKQKMPDGWAFGDDLFKRLDVARIEWDRDWRPPIKVPRSRSGAPDGVQSYLAAWLRALNS